MFDINRNGFASVETHAQPIVSTEFECLPSVLLNQFYTKPIEVLSVSHEQLLAVLSNNAHYRERFGLTQMSLHFPALPRAFSQSLFPKLGVVSWKDVVGMQTIPDALLNTADYSPVLECWLNAISDRMALTLHAYRCASKAPKLYLFPNQDFRERSEYRLSVSYGEVQGVNCYCSRRDYREEYLEEIKVWWSSFDAFDTSPNLTHIFVDIAWCKARCDYVIIDVNPNLYLFGQDVERRCV